MKKKRIAFAVVIMALAAMFTMAFVGCGGGPSLSDIRAQANASTNWSVSNMNVPMVGDTATIMGTGDQLGQSLIVTLWDSGSLASSGHTANQGLVLAGMSAGRSGRLTWLGTNEAIAYFGL